jgi:hypothetical protein
MPGYCSMPGYYLPCRLRHVTLSCLKPGRSVMPSYALDRIIGVRGSKCLLACLVLSLYALPAAARQQHQQAGVQDFLDFLSAFPRATLPFQIDPPPLRTPAPTRWSPTASTSEVTFRHWGSMLKSDGDR